MPAQDTDHDRPRQTPAELLTAWLADRDEPCPECGYSLRGLTPAADGATRCPECKAAIELGVRGATGTPGPWLLAFAAGAMGLGFDWVLGAVFFLITVISGGSGQTESIVMMLMLGGLGLGCLVLLHALREQRHQWAAWTASRQKARAGACFAGVFLVHLASAALFFWWVMSR